MATYTRARRQAETRPFGNQPLWERTNLATALRSLFSVFSQPAAQGSGGRAPLLGQPPASVPALSLLGEEDPEGRARPWRGYPSCGRCPVRARCRSGRSRYGRAGGGLLELLVIIIHYCCSSPPRSWAATEVEAHACVYMTRRHTRCAPAAGRAGAGPPAERPLPPCARTYPPFNFYPSLLLFPPPFFFFSPLAPRSRSSLPAGRGGGGVTRGDDSLAGHVVRQDRVRGQGGLQDRRVARVGREGGRAAVRGHHGQEGVPLEPGHQASTGHCRG